MLLVRLGRFIARAASWKGKGRLHSWRWALRHPRVCASKEKAWETSPSHSSPSRSPPGSRRQVGGTDTPPESVPLGEPNISCCTCTQRETRNHRAKQDRTPSHELLRVFEGGLLSLLSCGDAGKTSFLSLPSIYTSLSFPPSSSLGIFPLICNLSF